MTVYIEYVLIDNFIIDYLMLKASFALTNAVVTRKRLFFCSFLGAGFALIYPLISVHTVILTLIKICFGLLLVLLCGKFRSKKEFYVTSIVFFCYTFLTGGAVIGVFSIFGLPYSSEYSIALMVIPVYFIFSGLTAVVKHLYRQKEIMNSVRDIELTVNGITVFAKGFYDTGNGAYDQDKPIIVCSKRFAERFFKNGVNGLQIKKITIETVNGQSQNIALKVDQIKIYNGDKPNIFKKITLCVTKTSVGGGCDVILHPALKGENYEQTDVEIKKVS